MHSLNIESVPDGYTAIPRSFKFTEKKKYTMIAEIRRKRWHVATNELNRERVAGHAAEFKLTPLMSEVLLRKNLRERHEMDSFFGCDVAALHDPFQMLNMKIAVSRLRTAIDMKQKIMVYGDYDVDGTTSVALMYSFLKPRTDCIYYIPHRYSEGYGFSIQGVEQAFEEGCALIIALDCGIKDFASVERAKALGIDVIVCDHHTPGDEVPDAIVLDPKQANCSYPFKELCGCGVGFKLLQGLVGENEQECNELMSHLDLVAIAIAADIVPVIGENRTLAKLGLAIINSSTRPGLAALLQLMKRDLPLKLSDVVFGFAPKINAAGRLDSGMRAVELLIEDSRLKSLEIAAAINEFNDYRREMDAEITQHALEMLVKGQLDRYATVVHHADWHKGVIGIVASRLIEHHYRPTIVLTEQDGILTGSARSVEGFNLYDALAECSDLLEKFGGHYFAAGLSIRRENLESFTERFNAIAARCLTDLQREEMIVIDHEVRFSDLFLHGESTAGLPRIYRLLEQLEPFGPANEKPVFMITGVYATEFRLLKDAHLKLTIYDPICGISLPAVGFNLVHLQDCVASGCAFDCAFTLESNTWNHRTTLQLQIRDIRPTV